MADPQWISVGRIRGSHGVHGALKIEPFSHATDSVLCRIRRWRLVEPVADPGAHELPGAGPSPSSMPQGVSADADSTPDVGNAPGVSPRAAQGAGMPAPAARRAGKTLSGRASPASNVSHGASVPVARKRPLNLPMILRAGRCRVQGDSLVAEVVLLDGHPPLTREQAMALKGVEIQVDRADFPRADADEFYHADLIGCQVIGQGDARLGVVAGVDDHGAQQVLRLADDMLIPFVRQIVLSVDLDARQIRVDWAADWR